MYTRLSLFVVSSLLGCGARTGLAVEGDAGPEVAAADAAPLETCDWVKSAAREELVFANDLEYPTGVFIRGCRIYFTESASSSTSFGGKRTLGVYNLSTRTRTLLVDRPNNSYRVAVDSQGRIFLASSDGSTTSVSRVDPITRVESVVGSIAFDLTGVTVNKSDDLFVLGNESPAVGPGARSLFRLPAGRFGELTTFATGLGLTRCIAALEDDIYVNSTITGTSDALGLYRIDSAGARWRVDTGGGAWATESMSLSKEWLYGADSGGIWRAPLDDLRSPESLSYTMPFGSAAAVHYDDGLKAIAYIDRGEPVDGKYKTGSLRFLPRVE